VPTTLFGLYHAWKGLTRPSCHILMVPSIGVQGVVLGTVVDSNVLSYPMLVIMKEQGVVVGRGGASPRPLGKVEPVLSHRARWDLPSNVGRGGARPRGSGDVAESPKL